MPLLTIEATNNFGPFRELRIMAKVRANNAYYRNDMALRKRMQEFETELLQLVQKYCPVHVETETKLYDGNSKIFFSIPPAPDPFTYAPALLFDPIDLKQ